MAHAGVAFLFTWLLPLGVPCLLVQEWFADNEFWLVPYAAFCFLRDLFGTAEHWRWGTMSKPTPEVRSTLQQPCWQPTGQVPLGERGCRQKALLCCQVLSGSAMLLHDAELLLLRGRACLHRMQ